MYVGRRTLTLPTPSGTRTYDLQTWRLIFLSFPPHPLAWCCFLLRITIKITNGNSLSSDVAGGLLPGPSVGHYLCNLSFHPSSDLLPQVDGCLLFSGILCTLLNNSQESCIDALGPSRSFPASATRFDDISLFGENGPQINLNI
jgi:hypothetical protein